MWKSDHVYRDEAWGALRGRPLRYVLAELMACVRPSATNPGGVVTVGQLVQQLKAQGFLFAGRTSKVISDALRWEVLRGRVRRVGRGVYRLGAAPRSTMSRIRRRAESVRAHYAWVVNERLLGVTASVSPAVPLSPPVRSLSAHPEVDEARRLTAAARNVFVGLCGSPLWRACDSPVALHSSLYRCSVHDVLGQLATFCHVLSPDAVCEPVAVTPGPCHSDINSDRARCRFSCRYDTGDGVVPRMGVVALCCSTSEQTTAGARLSRGSRVAR